MRAFLSLCIVFCFAAVFRPAWSEESESVPNTLSEEEKLAGFELLFDGETLSPDIWQGSIHGYPVETKGSFICRKGGQLLTVKEYSDFIFRFEFKLPPEGNNGVGIRTPLGKPSSIYGIEIQILSDAYPDAKPWQKHGSIYGFVPAKPGLLRPDGQWNQEEILAVGPHIKVTVNGQVAVDADITGAESLDGDRPGIHNKSGFVGFLGHDDPVEFRNVRILALAGKENAEHDSGSGVSFSDTGR